MSDIENTRPTITLNRAEVEGLNRIIADREQHLREAQRLDQYLRQLVVDVVESRHEDPKGGWNLDLARSMIVPVEQPKLPVAQPVDPQA